MAQIRKTIEVDAAQDGAFSLLTDLDRLPDWSTITVATHDGPDQPLHTGDTFRQSLRIIGRPIDTEWTVTELDRHRHVAYEATGPAGARLRMAQTVDSTGVGSTVSFEVDYELSGSVFGDLSSLAERRNEREVEHSLHNLKELAEHR
jgi:carbon monoxide dehydrogenase subunit G